MSKKVCLFIPPSRRSFENNGRLFSFQAKGAKHNVIHRNPEAASFGKTYDLVVADFISFAATFLSDKKATSRSFRRSSFPQKTTLGSAVRL